MFACYLSSASWFRHSVINHICSDTVVVYLLQNVLLYFQLTCDSNHLFALWLSTALVVLFSCVWTVLLILTHSYLDCAWFRVFIG